MWKHRCTKTKRCRKKNKITWSKECVQIKRSSLIINIAAHACFIMGVISCQHAAAALRPGELRQDEPGKKRNRHPSLLGAHPWKPFFPPVNVSVKQSKTEVVGGAGVSVQKERERDRQHLCSCIFINSTRCQPAIKNRNRIKAINACTMRETEQPQT